jgi:hypothetical protein
VVIASALTGLAVLRMYFSLFCGRAAMRMHSSVKLGLRPREAWTFVALVVALVGLGVAPGALVDSRLRVSEDILRQRQEKRIEKNARGQKRMALDLRTEGTSDVWGDRQGPAKQWAGNVGRATSMRLP